MGYYSDAGLALTRKAREILIAKLSHSGVEPQTAEEVQMLLAHADVHHIDAKSGAEVWKWNCLKWYTGWKEYYPGIDFLDKFLGDLDEEEYRFIRVGEDYDDTEVRGGFWENPFGFELAREITVQPA